MTGNPPAVERRRAALHRRSVVKKLLLTLLALLALVPGPALAQAPACRGLTITGHPEYPPIGYRDGDRIVGAGATLVERIAGELKVPVQSKYTGTWEEAQKAAREGKVDIIFGIYFNDERATYLDYVRPAFMIDPVVVMVAKGKEFPFRGREDLVGRKGVTNAGESYGSELDAFIAQKLTVARTNGTAQAFDDLLSGKADYLIVGLYPGLADAADHGVKNRVEPLKTQLMKADMFIAFSKKSPCLPLIKPFGAKINAMRNNGSLNTMLENAIKTWNSSQK
jgi:polar amino acid transport system substrate-binding protein